jgi:hypothetical protein
MNLSKDEIEELNRLLKNKKLDLPDFRRTITSSCANYNWLQRNIGVRNKNIDPRLKTLLGFKERPVVTKEPEVIQASA